MSETLRDAHRNLFSCHDLCAGRCTLVSERARHGRDRKGGSDAGMRMAPACCLQSMHAGNGCFVGSNHGRL